MTSFVSALCAVERQATTAVECFLQRGEHLYRRDVLRPRTDMTTLTSHSSGREMPLGGISHKQSEGLASYAVQDDCD